MHKCPRTSCKGARARFIANTRVYNSCAHIYARISMKFKTLTHKIVIDHHIKFHEDPSFRCRDIWKTILVFVDPRNLPLEFGENWVSNRWNIIAVYFVVVIVYVDPRNLPLRFGQYWVSNSWDIAEIEFVWVVGGLKSF